MNLIKRYRDKSENLCSPGWKYSADAYIRPADLFLEKALRNASGIMFDLTEAEDLEELEDEAFWLCTARAEKHKGIEMW